LYNKIKYYITKYCSFSKCSNLFTNSSILNFLNISHIKQFLFQNKSSFYFLNNVDNYYFLKSLDFIKKDNFVAYKGSFFDEGAKRSDLIFPSSTFFEENYNYKSFNGLNLSTKKVISNKFYNNKQFFFFFYF